MCLVCNQGLGYLTSSNPEIYHNIAVPENYMAHGDLLHKTLVHSWCYVREHARDRAGGSYRHIPRRA